MMIKYPIHKVAKDFKKGSKDLPSKEIMDILTKYKDTNPLLTFTLAPHAPYTVPETLYQQAKAICDKYGISFVIASTPASSFIGVRPHAHSCPRDSG